MSLSGFSIKRPVFVTMLALIVVIVGFVSLRRLPIDLMPEISYPTISISTSYENTGPEEIEQIITRPLEEAMSAVPGVEEIYSISSEGSSNVRIMFSWGTDLDAAMDDARERLDRVIPRLPEEIDRPMLRKFDPAQMPIMMVGALSNLDPVQTRRILDEQISYRLERAPGVASVDIWGGHQREIRINLQPDRIKALGLPLDQITSRIKTGNLDLPAGVIERGDYEILIRVPGVFTRLDEIKDTVVATRNGVPIRIREIADVQDTFQKVTRIIRINDTPGTRLAIYKQSGTNTVEVAKAVKKELAKIQEDWPQIKFITVRDNSEYIQNAIANVGSSALTGGFLAILVLLFFLSSIRSTLVIAVSIPISVIATFALIYFGGFTLNVMTLGGLALGVGMLVDNSIVVLENIVRLQEEGTEPLRAASLGSSEVTAAIISSTATTLVVFLPMVFVRGIAGIMFKQLAYVISFSLVCSLLVALTLVPMMSSRFLRVARFREKPSDTLIHRLIARFQTFFVAMEEWYRRILHLALDHRLKVLLVTGALFVVSLALIKLVGSEFIPQTDEGEVRISVEKEVGSRLGAMDEQFKTLTPVIHRVVPELVSIEESIGGGWRSGSHVGNITIKLKPRSERDRSSDEIATALRRQLQNIPGAVIRTRAAGSQMAMLSGGGNEESVQVEIRGFDLDISENLAHQIKKVVEKVPGITDTKLSRDMGRPEELLVIDRQKAADMKLTVQQVGETLETVLSGTQASTFRESGDEFRILVKVKDAEKLTMDEILHLTLTNSDGQQISLRNVVDVKPRSGPQSIERRDRERILTITAEIEERELSEVLADIRAGIRRIPIPRNFEVNFTGDYEEQQKAFAELLLSIVLSLVLVYMVMAMQYESLRDPFIVMFSVPLAVIGVVWILLLTGTTFNMQSYIGCIMLGGIVVNNAILLVDHTNLLRRRDGMAVRQAIEEAGRRRLRPILMTALTTILAMIPLAAGIEEGSEAQAPLARVVVGGLISSTVITLVVVPIVYSLFEGLRERRKRRAQ